MKKSLFIMALGAIALTSCSQDEIIEVQKDAISFAAITENAGRATITTTSTIADFKVWGIVAEGGNYLNYFDPAGEVINVTGLTNLSSGYYWPSGTMDFYAVSPSTIINASVGSPSEFASNTAGITGVEVSNATAQTDILYALTTGQTKKTEDVPLNFKHALSQVVFKVKIADNVEQDIEVKLNSVTVKNLIKKGNFSFPKAATTDAGVGSWTLSEDAGDAGASYVVSPTDYIIDNIDATTATNVTEETNPMLIIPQSHNIESSKANWNVNGLFVVNTTVTAKYNRDANPDYETSINLVNTPTYIPVTFAWEPGKKYVYTFIYDANGNGGVDENGDEQMLPITFSVNVVDFVTDLNGDSQDNDEEEVTLE